MTATFWSNAIVNSKWQLTLGNIFWKIIYNVINKGVIQKLLKVAWNHLWTMSTDSAFLQLWKLCSFLNLHLLQFVKVFLKNKCTSSNSTTNPNMKNSSNLPFIWFFPLSFSSFFSFGYFSFIFPKIFKSKNFPSYFFSHVEVDKCKTSTRRRPKAGKIPPPPSTLSQGSVSPTQ